MFTTPCFLRKNTKEIANTIALIGYDLLFSARNNYGEYLVCNGNSCQGQNDTTLKESTIDFIDCGENEEMFFAIAALQDNIDINQLFKMDIEALYTDFPKGSVFKATKLGDGRHVGTNINPFYCHKLSVEEIIEYFKK